MKHRSTSKIKRLQRLFALMPLFLEVLFFHNLQAAQLKTYNIKKCNKEKLCWIASGNIAYVDNGGTYLSAENGRLEVVDLDKNTSEHWTCNSLNYNLTSEFLMCNNSEVQAIKTTSVIIDRSFHVNKISFNLALRAK